MSNTILRNVIAIIAGLVVGNIINGGLIALSGHIIPMPAGVNNQTIEGLKAGIHLFEPKHFLFPFLAHALGTLGGAFVAAKISLASSLRVSLIVGVFFFLGGAYMVYLLPFSPIWFSITDLALAYFPMAYWGYKLSAKRLS